MSTPTQPTLNLYKEVAASGTPEMHYQLSVLQDLLTVEWGLTIRADSRLVWGYLTGSLDEETWPVYRIVEELGVMHLLHNYTSYDAQYKSTIPQVRHSLKTVMPGSHTRQYVRTIIIPMYRALALAELDVANCPAEGLESLAPLDPKEDDEDSEAGDQDEVSEISDEDSEADCDEDEVSDEDHAETIALLVDLASDEDPGC